jgi:cell division protein FtsQ
LPAVNQARRRPKKGRSQGPAARRRLPSARSLALVLGLAGAVFLYGAFKNGHGARLADWAGESADAALAAAGISVQDVTLKGRQYTKAADVLAALAVTRGSSMVGFDARQARARVEGLSWVRAASVMRLFPDTIHVELDEYAPFALWRRGDGLVVVDERGVVVSDLDVRSFPHLPLVEGAGAGPAAAEFLPVLRQRPALFARTEIARRIGDRRWTLALDNGVAVLLPEEGVEVALDELLRMDERSGLLGRDIVAVDLRLKDRVTVLPRPRDDGDPRTAASAKTGGDI